MMEKLLDEVLESVEKEYGRAAARFGCTNHSDHESYAILQEELEEAHVEVESVSAELLKFWRLTKSNDGDTSKYECLRDLERCAVLAACEFIQVAAMAKKAAMTIGDRTVVVDLTGTAGDRE